MDHIDRPYAGRVAAVWGEARFTSRARKMIADGEYKYGSPALNWGARDKATGEPQGLTLTSFALTNTPVLDRMPAIQLSEAYRAGEERYSSGYPGALTIGALKLSLAEDRRRSEVTDDPRIELDKINLQLSERAGVIAREREDPIR